MQYFLHTFMAIKMANEGDGNWIKKENKSVNQEKSLVQSYKGGVNTPHSPIGGPLKSKQQPIGSRSMMSRRTG